MTWFHQKLTRLFEGFVLGGIRSEEAPINRRRIAVMNIFTLIAVVNLIPLGIVAYRSGDVDVGAFDLVLVAVLIGCQIHLRLTGRYTPARNTGISVAAALFYYLFVTGGVSNTGFIWMFTFPMFVTFLLGAGKGAVAAVALFGAALVTVELGRLDLFDCVRDYSSGFKIRFVSSYLVVTMFAYFSERSREASETETSTWPTLSRATTPAKLATRHFETLPT